MANTITAGNATNNGLALLPDNTGALNILTGSGSGTAAISIDASQNVTAAAGLTVTGASTLTGNTSITGNLTLTGNASGVLKSGTAVASTSGTSITFTGIPSTAERITVMLNGVSTNGTSLYQIQLGTSGGIVSTGYNSTISNQAGAINSATTGFLITASATSATDTVSGIATITNISSTNWVYSSIVKASTALMRYGAGDGAIGGVVDRVRVTTVNGTDTFDAGTINILWE